MLLVIKSNRRKTGIHVLFKPRTITSTFTDFSFANITLRYTLASKTGVLVVFSKKHVACTLYLGVPFKNSKRNCRVPVTSTAVVGIYVRDLQSTRYEYHTTCRILLLINFEIIHLHACTTTRDELLNTTPCHNSAND